MRKLSTNLQVEEEVERMRQEVREVKKGEENRMRKRSLHERMWMG